MADDLLTEFAPLLAEDGIDLSDPSAILDMQTLQNALTRAVERGNMQLFTPVGQARALALTTLRRLVGAIADGQAELAESILATVVPESPDGSQATVAGTIGVALDLLYSILFPANTHRHQQASVPGPASRRDTGSASAPPAPQ